MKQSELNKDQQAFLTLVTDTTNLLYSQYMIKIPEANVFIVLQAYGIVKEAIKELQEEHGVQ